MFRLFGIPVRVEPTFVFSAFLLGGDFDPLRIFVWLAIVFVSILAHELGHAFAGRMYGLQPSITLQAFGGYTAWEGGRTTLTPWRGVWLSFAGPLAGFVLGGAIYFFVPAEEFAPGGLAEFAYWASLRTTIGWSIFNLFPIIPLDGGHIMQALFALKTRNPVPALIVSLFVSAALVALGLASHNWFMVFFLVMMAVPVAQGIREAWNAPAPRRIDPAPRSKQSAPPPREEAPSEIDPRLREALQNAAKRFREGDPVPVDVLEAAAAQLPSTDEKRLARQFLVWELLNRRDVEGAQRVLQSLPDDAIIDEIRVRLRLTRESADAVIADLRKTLDPANPAEAFVLARVLIDARRTADLLELAKGPSGAGVPAGMLAAAQREAFIDSRFDESAAIGVTLFERRPSADVAFNVACAHSRAGRVDDGAAWLSRAVEAGFRDLRTLESDPDVEALRTTAAYAEAIRRLRGKA